ncbi:MAG: hypothetical protein C0598_12690 [Marinilabiliales bacterium]|nr:MAG: hypothetical protein C0598_12690 [Marinilabiliales bacterium]
MTDSTHKDLFSRIYSKSKLKQEVYKNTSESFEVLNNVLQNIESNYNKSTENLEKSSDLSFELKQNGKFELEVKFGGDILLFMMHTNIFEFPRKHSVMQTSYIKEDSNRSYCGVIYIYNFLADSFKYNRVNDLGYLIGRIFINNEKHYFVEGKKELGFIYNNFGNNVINSKSMEEIATAAIDYTLNFDLLCPPYETQKEISVNLIKNTLDTISIKTGKRIGFKFQADNDNIESGN